MKVSHIALLSLLSVTVAGATTLTVTSTADSGAGTLRAALASAANGDTIDASGISGTILLTSGELLVDTSVNIIGPGATALAIDGNNSSRALHIIGSNAVTISDLTITNGKTTASPYSGGGIWNDHAAVYVNRCVISGNHLDLGSGGGIYNQGDLAVTDSALNYNRAAGSGGGIYSDGGTVAITNSSLSSNWTLGNGSGGGIYNASGKLTIVGSILQLNNAGNGGGIYNLLAPSSVILNSALNQNGAAGEGGGIYNGLSELTLLGCAFYDNGANNNGGGVINSSATLTVVNGTFSYNHAATFGGAIYNRGTGMPGLTLVLNSTFSRNAGTSGAGGLYNLGYGSQSALIRIGSTLLNADPSDGNTLSNAVGTVTSLGHNLSSDDGGSCLNQPNDLINTDPMLGPSYWYNGGFIPWYSGVYTLLTQDLLPGSPAIDMGTNFTGSATDQRGQPRTYDNPGVSNIAGGDGTDIGAVEFIPPALSVCLNSNNATLTWPAPLYWPIVSPTYTVESTTILGNSAVWTTVPGTPTIIGNQYALTNGPVTGTKFYRLQSP